MQQELARYQMMLERNHDEFSQKNQLRQRHEQELVDVRHVYKDTQLTVNMEKKKGKTVPPFRSVKVIGRETYVCGRRWFMCHDKSDD